MNKTGSNIEVLIDDDIDFEKYLQETDPSEKVQSMDKYLGRMMHLMAPAHEAPKYPKMPFRECWFYFQPGEVTVWCGFNGAGKSVLQGQVLSDFSIAGEKVCIASMEMEPARSILRICRQKANKKTLTHSEAQDVIGQHGGRLFFYDQRGMVRPDRLVAVMKHCAENLGVKHFAIDSLMKCVRGTDDYNGQKDFVAGLTVVARDLNIHIHLVAHLKKPEGMDKMPNRYNIKGASEISDLADNVVILWRNEKKEADKEAGKKIEDATVSDSVLIIDKSRNGEWEGRIPLWYDRSTMQFFDFYKQRGIL